MTPVSPLCSTSTPTALRPSKTTRRTKASPRTVRFGRLSRIGSSRCGPCSSECRRRGSRRGRRHRRTSDHFCLGLQGIQPASRLQRRRGCDGATLPFGAAHLNRAIGAVPLITNVQVCLQFLEVGRTFSKDHWSLPSWAIPGSPRVAPFKQAAIQGARASNDLAAGHNLLSARLCEFGREGPVIGGDAGLPAS